MTGNQSGGGKDLRWGSTSEYIFPSLRCWGCEGVQKTLGNKFTLKSPSNEWHKSEFFLWGCGYEHLFIICGVKIQGRKKQWLTQIAFSLFLSFSLMLLSFGAIFVRNMSSISKSLESFSVFMHNNFSNESIWSLPLAIFSFSNCKYKSNTNQFFKNYYLYMFKKYTRDSYNCH